ncbi:tol-pal system-associated acyl-CoA thioesterase [Thermithiobacillus plumbiphilus]|uniref:Tol-pal system-associated acyl-CoA thioesterase n=1 Tax=Thermithiobacillus plumbiphilus TaxID=1729899 RepID=A0ABU9D4L3_9PROT
MPDCTQHHIRVYYEDTDHGGVVYHANYLRFMERARTEMLRCMGFELDALERDPGIIFAVRRASLDFRAPARFNDHLRIESRLQAVTGARLQFEQGIFVDDRLLCKGDIEVVCLESGRFRPTALPRVLVEAAHIYLSSSKERKSV